MIIKHLPEDGNNFIPFEIAKNTIDFDEGELMFNVAKKERDYEVTIDICQDYTGSLVMGTDEGNRYVAQLVVPAREYIETIKENPAYMADDAEGAESPTITDREPAPFDIEKCELRLWEMEA